MSNPFKKRHNGDPVPAPTYPPPPPMPNPKRETVYLTPQQVMATMSEEERALITPWPEPSKPKASVANAHQWNGFHAQTPPLPPAASQLAPSIVAPPHPPDIDRAESLYDPRTLPRLQTVSAQAQSHHSPKPSSSSTYSYSNPNTPRKSANKPTLTSVFNRRPPSPPPLPAQQHKLSTGFSLTPTPPRASTSGSFTGSDISVSVSMSSSSLAALNRAIPTPYGSSPSHRTRKRTSSSDDYKSATPAPSVMLPPPQPPPEAKSSMMGRFGRLKQKMSTTSLRTGRSPANGGEWIPPLPVRAEASTSNPSSTKRAASAPKTPTTYGFGSKVRPNPVLVAGARERKSASKAKSSKHSRSAPTVPEEPVEEEAYDDEFKTTTFFENVDFDNLNPDEFVVFEADSRAHDQRSSVDTLAVGEGEDDVLVGPMVPAEGVHPRPSLVRQSTQTASTEFEIPDSWAVLTEEALAKEEGLESEAEESEEEEEHAAGGIVFLEKSDWVEETYDMEEMDGEEEGAATGKNVGEEGVEDAAAAAGDDDDGPMMYALRVYRPNGMWHVVACPLTATAYEIRNAMVERFGLENEGMIGRYRLFIVEKGQERMLMKKEKPVVILRRRLLTAGHTKLDSLSSQGGRELQHLCRFVLQMSLLHGLPEEHDGMFDHSGGIVKLDDVNLQTIPAELHKVAMHLVKLSLRHNPITDLPKDFLMATTQLKELNLSRTALKRIPAAISYCTSLETLDVSYNRIKTVEMAYGGLQKLTQLKRLRLHANVIDDLPSSIAQLPLIELRLDMNRLGHLPVVVCHLDSLDSLILAHNELVDLPASLGALVRLRVLSIAGNKIQALPTEIRYLTSLAGLDLSRNRIVDISAISSLASLHQLDVSHNLIGNLALQLPRSLRAANFSYNTFTRFSPTAAASLIRTTMGLQKLDLSHTKLSSLSFDFTIFPQLHELVLDDSRIGELPPSVTKLERLTKLSACNASLKHLPDALGDMVALTELMVHSNDLTSVPESIWMCPSLVVFNASSNKLTNFPNSPSGGVPPLVRSLKELYLADNRLIDAVLLPLSVLKYLTVLNVSYNALRDIPDGTLRSFTNMEGLFLSGNALMAIRGEELPPTLTVKRLYLNNNRLQSLPVEIAKYHHLTVLDVGNNLLKYNINNFGYDYQWIWNEALKMLNLSGNKRLRIDKPHLGAKDKDKPHFNGADFRVFKDLQSLGLMDVTLAVTYLPEETDRCRIRTSASTLNGMRYGVSDSIGKEIMGSFDLAVPKYRGHEGECLFGIFSREQPPKGSGAQTNSLTRYLTTHFRSELTKELLYIKRDPKLGNIPDAMRRTFLNLNKSFYDSIVNPTGVEMPIKSGSPFESGDPAARHLELQTGACACVAYLVDKTLYIANVGNVEAIVGGDHGKMDGVTTLHGPFEPREEGRIKKAEAWVAPKGILKGDLNVSRAFGFYSRFPVVNPSPDIMKIQLSSNDQFMIIGNSEFWSHIKKNAAADIVRGHHIHGDGMSAAQELRDVALGHGATGNVQVMVIMLSDVFRSPSMDLDRGRIPDLFDRRAGGSSMTVSTRERMGSKDDAPIGKVALVFTDIRNSTALWERLGGRMQYSLDIHNRCLRRILRLCGGYEVKTEGDAFMVSFSTLLAAVRWCLTVQVQLLKENWPPELLECEDGKEVYDQNGRLIERGVSVRMGIHYGIPLCEPDPTTGRMDYFGPMVNRSARVNGSARGGEIMLSADVVKIVQYYMDLEYDDSVDDSRVNSPSGSQIFMQKPSSLTPEDQLHSEAIKELNPVLRVVGETKLKGIELPEFLSLLFPRSLLGRHKFSSASAHKAQVPPPPSDQDPDACLGVSKESIISLAVVCKRLEALDAGLIFRLFEDTGHQTALYELHASPGIATPGGSSSRSSEIEQHVIYGREDELLPSLTDYSSDDQVMQVVDSLIERVEHSITRLRLRHAVQHPEVRQAMLDKAGFDPDELLHLFRHVSAAVQSPRAPWLNPRPIFV